MNSDTACVTAGSTDARDATLWTAEELISRNTDLVSLPEIYMRARQTLDDPDSGLGDLAEVIAHDPGLTARLLKLANSALYGLRAQMGSVRHAITLLGAQKVNDLVLLTSVTRSFKGVSNLKMNMDLFWQTGVYCAAMSSLLGERLDDHQGDGLFIAGLLHDVGHLIMYQAIPSECNEMLRRADDESRALHELESEYIGCDYAQVGGALLQNWTLPEYLARPVLQHLDPVNARDYVVDTAIVHLAAQVARCMAADVSPTQCRPILDPVILELAGLTQSDVEDARMEADKLSREVLGLIFPGHGQMT